MRFLICADDLMFLSVNESIVFYVFMPWCGFMLFVFFSW